MRVLYVEGAAIRDGPSHVWVYVRGRSSPRLPLSASACLTCLRNVSRSMPKSSATCATGRLLSSASRTPRSINSGGYFLALGIPEGSPLPRTKPRNKAPVEHGLAHPSPPQE